MSLSENQAERLRQALSSTQEILAAGVAKLLLYQPRQSATGEEEESVNGWIETGIWGAVLFTYDQSCDQHLFRLFDLEHYELRFEYEVYEDLQLDQLSEQLLGFEADNFYVAFLFADERDATDMLTTVEEEAPRAADALQLIALNQQQSVEQESTHAEDADPMQNRRLRRIERFFGLAPNTLGGVTPLFTEQRKLQDALKGNMSILSTDFHIALTEEGTLNISSIPTPLKQFFKQVGIRKRDLRKPQTAKTIISALREANVIVDFDVRDATLKAHDEATAPNAEDHINTKISAESDTIDDATGTGNPESQHGFLSENNTGIDNNTTQDGNAMAAGSGIPEHLAGTGVTGNNVAADSPHKTEAQTKKFSPRPPAKSKDSGATVDSEAAQSSTHTTSTNSSPVSQRSTSQRKHQGRSSVLFTQQTQILGENKDSGEAKDEGQAQTVSKRLRRRASATTRGLNSYTSEGSEESSVSKSGSKRKQNGLKGALQAAILTGSRRKKADAQPEQPKKAEEPDEQPTGPEFLKEIKKGGNSGGFALKRVNKKQDDTHSEQKDSSHGQKDSSHGGEEKDTAPSTESPKKRTGRVSVVNFSNEGQALTVMEKLKATMNARRQQLEPDEDESTDSASDWSD